MASASPLASLSRIVAEIDDLARRMAGGDEATLDEAVAVVEHAKHVFVHGAGRSGLALRMTAMRLMHLGVETHVVGETTTPAIHAGDVLIAASGSGTTAGVVRVAQTAVDTGATLLAFTTAAESPLAHLASVTVLIPATTKTDRSESRSTQYAGSLFEQGVALIGDALFDALWQRSGLDANELWPRHANLE